MKRNACARILCVGVIILCACLNTLIATEINGARYIPLDSWLYEGLDTLYQHEGKVIPFTARPYAVDEFAYYLHRIDKKNLSEAGQKLLDRIEREMDADVIFQEKKSAFSVTAIISPELYLNTDKSLIWDNANQHYLDKYVYGYVDRVPLLSIPVQFWAGDYFYSEIDIDIKEQPGIGLYPATTFNGPSTNDPYINWNNIPMGFDHIFHHFPDSYYLSFGNTHWNLYMGSGEYSVGTGRTGNLILSKDAHKITGLRLSWYNTLFRYNFAYLSLHPGLGNSGRYEHGSRMSLDLGYLTHGYNPSIYSVNLDDSTSSDRFDGYMDTGSYPYKGYLTHSMEFRLFDEKFYVAVTEAAVYARSVPELFTFMPLAFWHNGNNGSQTNSLLSLDLQLAIGPWAQLYASGVLDQFTMSHETSSTEPAAHGIIAGAFTRVPVGDGFITGGAEYVYTSDWLYTHRYWLQTPTVNQRNTAITRGGYNVRLLGYSMGNDYQQAHVEAGYARLGEYSLSLSYNYGVKGPFDVFMRLPQEKNGTVYDPKGDRANWPNAIHHQIGLVGHYNHDNAIDLGLHTYYTHVTNYKNQAG
ncbi:MAG: hypothetical protein WDA14_11845, partial [Sphaerochaetaceae bacterium]